MRGKDADVMNERLRRVEEMLDRVDRGVEKIELVTVIREPNTGAAADAYNGLRKQIIAAVAERMSHLSQLAQFDAALRTGATVDDLASLGREWLAQAGVTVVEDIASAPEAFEMVGDGHGAPVVRRPAYVDSTTGRTVRMGVAERSSVAARAESTGDAEPATAAPDVEAKSAEPVAVPVAGGSAADDETANDAAEEN